MTNYQRGKALLLTYTCYTPDFAAAAKKAGRWGYEPRVGAVIEFYSSSKGRIGHVGIVVECEYRNGVWEIDTVEGNTSSEHYDDNGGCVAMHHYSPTPGQIGGKNRIAGFLYPAFYAETCSAEQFIAVARSQVGYIEKASNHDLLDFKANPGSANYTKYGAWAAACGWGCNPGQWCAMFVSWCGYMACVSAHDYVPGWFQDGDIWRYRKQDGQLAADEWMYDGGRWYAFDGSGRMVKGWFLSEDEWYYLADDGGMCASQWVTDDGNSYFLTHTGAMAKNAYVRSDKPISPGVYIYYWVDEQGVWRPEYDTEKPYLDIYQLAY